MVSTNKAERPYRSCRNAAFLVLCCIAVSLSCDAGVIDPAIHYLRITNRSLSTAQLDSVRLVVRLLNAAGEEVSDSRLDYRSLTPGLLRVNADGWVVSLGGVATGRVVASGGGRADTAAVTVVQVPDHLVLSDSTLAINEFTETTLEAQLVDRIGGRVASPLEFSASGGGAISMSTPLSHTRCFNRSEGCWGVVIRGLRLGTASVTVRSGGVESLIPVVVFRDPAIVQRIRIGYASKGVVSVAAVPNGPAVFADGRGNLFELVPPGSYRPIPRTTANPLGSNRLLFTADGAGMFAHSALRVGTFENLVEQPATITILGVDGDGGMTDAALSPNGNSLIITQEQPLGAQGVAELNRATLAVERSIDLPWVRGVAAAAGGNRVFALTAPAVPADPSTKSFRVHIFEWPSYQLVDSVSIVESWDVGMRFAVAAGRFAYVSGETWLEAANPPRWVRWIEGYDLQTGTRVRKEFPSAVTSMTATDDGNYLIATIAEPGEVVVFRVPQMHLVARVFTAGMPLIAAQVNADTIAVGNRDDWLDIIVIPELLD